MKYSLIILLFFSFSCHEYSQTESAKVATLESVGNAVIEDSFDEIVEIPTSGQPPLSEPENTSESLQKKVVKTGGMTFETGDIEKTYQSIRKLLPKYNAYIEDERQTQYDESIRFFVVIRVPAGGYDTLYQNFNTLAGNVDSKYSNARDVTEQFYDLKTRISNKEALEKRYTELLKKAVKIDDMLTIEYNINEVRTEIERLQGKFNYLSKQIGYSTIKLEFYKKLPYEYKPVRKDGMGDRILSAFGTGWEILQAFIVGLVTIWPFILLAIGLIILFKYLKRRRKSSKNE